MKLLHFHSHHQHSPKEDIIYSQALPYNIIISEDYALQEELNKLTPIPLACAYPLHFIIKSIKRVLIYTPSILLSLGTPYTEPNILPIITPFLNINKSFTTTIHESWHTIPTLSPIWPSKPSSAYTKSSFIHNHLVHSAQTYGSSQRNS